MHARGCILIHCQTAIESASTVLINREGEPTARCPISRTFHLGHEQNASFIHRMPRLVLVLQDTLLASFVRYDKLTSSSIDLFVAFCNCSFAKRVLAGCRKDATFPTSESRDDKTRLETIKLDWQNLVRELNKLKGLI